MDRRRSVITDFTRNSWGFSLTIFRANPLLCYHYDPTGDIIAQNECGLFQHSRKFHVVISHAARCAPEIHCFPLIWVSDICFFGSTGHFWAVPNRLLYNEIGRIYGFFPGFPTSMVYIGRTKPWPIYPGRSVFSCFRSTHHRCLRLINLPIYLNFHWLLIRKENLAHT